jgi:aspartate kinase
MSGSNGDGISLAVVKFGGSVLAGAKTYRRAARFLRNRLSAAPGERYVAVVSARLGATDALERTARGAVASPSARTLDLLWSTGEIRSVALLTLHLEALGVRAAGLDVHATGLRVGSAGEVSLDAERLHAALAGNQVAVVPGFLATNAKQEIVTLGRGGSDLTAVLLAAGLGAARCELVKDVSGYFSADPHRDAAARHLPALTFAETLALAEAGCDLVQRQAIEAAARADIPLVVRSLDESAPASVVSAGARAAGAGPRCAGAKDFDSNTFDKKEKQHGIRNANDSRGTALGTRNRSAYRAHLSNHHIRAGGAGLR